MIGGASWLGSMYDFQHYHSNSHEVLVIIAGSCLVQFGGEQGPKYTVNPGDVVIIPAGVAHRSIHWSDDFKCIGAYPCAVDLDMNFGSEEEYSQALKTIKELGLPKQDPIFGKNGLLFDY